MAHLRPEDLHHLRRARHDREHRAPRARPRARRAAGHEGASRASSSRSDSSNDDGSLGEHNGVRCIGIEHKMGIHASPTCTLEYDDAVGYLIGEPNTGMRLMFTMMNIARLSVGLSGPRHRRARVPAGARLRDRTAAGARRRRPGGRGEPDHRPRRRPPHAPDHARARRGDARARLRERGGGRPGAPRRGRRRCAGARRSWPIC